MYCKSWRDFSLDIFSPGIKIIDFIKENMVQNEDFKKDFIYVARFANIYDEQRGYGLCGLGNLVGHLERYLKDEEACEEFYHICANNEENIREFEAICKIIANHGFTHANSDSFLKSCRVSFIIGKGCDESEDPTTLAIYDYMMEIRDFVEFYESTKPISNRDLSLIIAILKNTLSRSQFEMLEFYIFKTTAYDDYRFTEQEAEALRKACYNIRNAESSRSKIKTILER